MELLVYVHLYHYLLTKFYEPDLLFVLEILNHKNRIEDGFSSKLLLLLCFLLFRLIFCVL